MDKYFQVVWFCFLLSGTLSGQMTADSSFIKIEETLLAQLAVYPQEKIHLHTDRDLYVPGEKIWIKAYIVDAVTHLYPTNSRYIYVELIDNRDSLVGRVMIRPDNDMFYGHLNISENIPEGNYTLRAYTRYMENMGDDYFFKKNIRIGSKGINPLVSRNRGNGDDFEVSFFPEGGNLVDGVFCKVAFKALNRNGYAETISGDILDENGSVITSVETFYAGMGVFTFIPQAEKKYFLKCRNNDGLEKQFELHQADPRACSLVANTRNNTLTLGIRQTVNNPDSRYYLLAHCRGQVFHFSTINKDNEFIAFQEDALPAGVLQFVLFDERMNPLSERLVFSKNYDNAQVEFLTDKAMYAKREKVSVTIDVARTLRRAEIEQRSEDATLNRGDLSIAITDDRDYAVDESTTILSTLFLSSELKGYIENPAYYLQNNVESVTALDYLMLTHGWRRYNIPEVVKENYELPKIPFQESMEISGRVTGGIRSRSESDADVFIKVNEDYDLTSTDENGTFVFRNFEYPDSTSYFIQALSRRGNNNVEVVIDDKAYPQSIYAFQSLFSRQKTNDTETKDEIGINAFLEKAEQRSQYDDDMRVIQLGEVEVTAPRIERKDEPRLQYWANTNSDVTVRREDFEKSAPLRVADLLRNIPGVYVSSTTNQIIIRGLKSDIFPDWPQPLVLVDGVQIPWPDDTSSPFESPLETVSVQDVESIDVFKGPNAAMFGVRASGGVISITTRRGIDVVREVEKMRADNAHNYTHYSPLGYQKPVEFYSPKYETLEAKYQSIPDYRTTIFWKPNIVIDDDGEASFEFYTSDFPTTYSVVIEGLTTDGRIVRQIEKIHIQ